MAFWNRKDDSLGVKPGDGKDPLGISPPPIDNLSQPSPPPDIEPVRNPGEPFGMSSPMSQPSIAPPPNNIEKDLSLINAKLDAIKAEISHMHQRIQNIENIAHESQKPQPEKKAAPQQQYRW